MSEMVERAAMAIYASLGGDDPQATPWPDLREKDKDGFRSQVRVTIEAMREPTPEMVDAADPHGIIMANFETAWQAMIDEALK
jgi:hypothetical protein